MCAILLFTAAIPADARNAAAPVTPGTYEDWGPDIDRIEILKSFRLADYRRVALMPLDTAGVKLPEQSDNTYAAVVEMLPKVAEELAAGMRGKVAQTVAVGSENAPRDGTLLIRGKLTLLDPGSKAARYWGGFGAGAVKVEIQCEIVDVASGSTLVAFTQQRRSGFGAFGGGYSDLMARTLRQIGDDEANLLKQF